MVSFSRYWQTIQVSLLASPAILVMAFLFLLACIVQPKALTLPILMIVLRQTVPLALLSLGQSLPIIGRSIDLSVGGVIALVNVLLALSFFQTGHPVFSLVVPLLLGGGVGLLNGIFIVYLRASAVVVTLGMALILVGGSYVICGGAPGGEVNSIVRTVAMKRLDVFPVAVLFVLILVLLSAFVLHKLVVGQSLYALGSNYRAARLAGIPLNRTLLLAHVSCGVFAGLAGIMLTGYIGTGTLNLGSDLVLASIAAVILGGINFGGGKGSMLGVIAGAFAITYLGVLLTSMNVGQPSQLILQGCIVATAAAIAQRKGDPTAPRTPQQTKGSLLLK